MAIYYSCYRTSTPVLPAKPLTPTEKKAAVALEIRRIEKAEAKAKRRRKAKRPPPPPSWRLGLAIWSTAALPMYCTLLYMA